jgi:superfamily II RNA helicase
MSDPTTPSPAAPEAIAAAPPAGPDVGPTAGRPGRPRLADHLPDGPLTDPGAILERFLDWVAATGLELYPAQEEAILELVAGRHVILNTPTGSGKSLVALALHFKAVCEGRTSVYTSPIKALASEKFFSLCDDFGAERVGMLTGDAAINAGAPVVCCTAEVLSNMALRRGESLDTPYVVMDEFHYYSDPDRGVAWQVPLILLPRTTFLLMSATLGNTAPISERLERRSRREVATVSSDERPVPLDWDYRETPLHETVQELLDGGRAPIYIVNFTQRECAELAQSLTSLKLASREERDAIAEAIGGFRFDTPYGKEFRRFLSFGIGVHHAGLLPKYRLLVEQLAQAGRLKVISGTDTLGVGVNIPIRTVLFTKLAKYDGKKVGILSVRDFKQIAGRAGRKGFDDRGSVVAQAPEHIVEKRQIDRSDLSDKKKRKRLAKKRGPAKGDVGWTRETFDSLIARPPEMLESRFKITHGMVLDLLGRDAEADDPERGNFASLRELIALCHEDDGAKRRLISEAAARLWSLYRAGVVRLQRDTASRYLWVVVDQDLQTNFSLHQALSLYLVETLGRLDPAEADYPLDLLSLVEAILEDPRVVLLKQADRAKQELLGRLKAEGVPYEERIERLEEVTHPKPLAELIYETFNRFRASHRWVEGEAIRPKSGGREMFEGFVPFADYVRLYGLQRSEGVLLRYLSQLYKTLVQSVPDRYRDEAVLDAIGFFRAVLERTDTSLLEEWESLLHPELHAAELADRQAAREALRAHELLDNPKAFTARVRAELHQLVRALARRDWEEAAAAVRPPAAEGPAAAPGSEAASSETGEPDAPWTPERFEEALAPYFADYDEILFTPEARQAHWTRIDRDAPRLWRVRQTLLDPEGDNLWHLEGVVDLSPGTSLEGPLVSLRRLGT